VKPEWSKAVALHLVLERRAAAAQTLALALRCSERESGGARCTLDASPKHDHRIRNSDIVRFTEARETLADLIERARAQLVQCGPCDAGILGPCTCPAADPRSVILDLLRLIDPEETP
jgi:hypothetical protein